MRILLVAEFFSPRPRGGISRHLRGLVTYLSKQGDEVHVLTSKLTSRTSRGSLPEGTRVMRRLLPLSNVSFFNKLTGIYASYDLMKELNRIGDQYDVVHVHSMRTHFLYCLSLSKPKITTMHSVFPICIRESFLHGLCKSTNGARCAICYATNNPTHALIAPAIAIQCNLHYKLMRKSLISVQKVICVSEYIKQEIGNRLSFPKHKMITIPNGVDIKAFADIQPSGKDQFRKKIARPNERIILFVGRLVYRKGVHVLIAAMPEILKRVDAKLIIVGGVGYMKDFLERQVHRAGLNGKVSFMGSVDDQTLKLLYKSADVCVVPSLFEPFGITAIEAFAAQTPLVVADSGGLSEIVAHNRTGVKVIPNNAKSLAEGVMKVLLDPSFAQRIRSNAYREVLQKYKWEKVGQKLRHLYQNICDEYPDN